MRGNESRRKEKKTPMSHQTVLHLLKVSKQLQMAPTLQSTVNLLAREVANSTVTTEPTNTTKQSWTSANPGPVFVVVAVSLIFVGIVAGKSYSVYKQMTEDREREREERTAVAMRVAARDEGSKGAAAVGANTDSR